MRAFNGFEEIKSAVGTEVGASEWIVITQEHINTFAEATCGAPDGLRVHYRLVVEIEGGARPACVAEPIALHLR
jgi:hypothetical protein